MDDARLIEIAAELEADAGEGWASAAIEREGVELTASPKGFRRLAALMLRATASGGGFYFDGLADLFKDQPAIYSLGVSWDAPPDWKPPEQGKPWGLWVLLAVVVAFVAAVAVFAVIGFLAVIR